MVLHTEHGPTTTITSLNSGTFSGLVNYIAVVADECDAGESHSTYFNRPALPFLITSPELAALKMYATSVFVMEANLFNPTDYDDVHQAACEMYACGKFVQQVHSASF